MQLDVRKMVIKMKVEVSTIYDEALQVLRGKKSLSEVDTDVLKAAERLILLRIKELNTIRLTQGQILVLSRLRNGHELTRFDIFASLGRTKLQKVYKSRDIEKICQSLVKIGAVQECGEIRPTVKKYKVTNKGAAWLNELDKNGEVDDEVYFGSK